MIHHATDLIRLNRDCCFLLGLLQKVGKLYNESTMRAGKLYVGNVATYQIRRRSIFTFGRA